MNKIRKSWKLSLLMAMIMMFSMCMPVLAAADDNSLAALNVQNGTVTPDFVYSTWEYDVTVEAGTTELLLEPVTSDGNATITSITGTILEDGEATVMVNTMSESGIPMTYTLHVTESDEAAQKETEEVQETEVVTEEQTEAPTEMQEQTEVQTEAVATNALQDQVTKLKSNSDLMMKIMYGLIALSVILLFLIINLILKNRDLKDDLKDAEDQLAYQTNEFARKERNMATDNYYAPTQPGAATPREAPPYQGGQTTPPVQNVSREEVPAYTPVQQSAPVVEETFGSRVAPGGYQGMQPEDVPANRPITAAPEPKPQAPRQQPVQQQGVPQSAPQQPVPPHVQQQSAPQQQPMQQQSVPQRQSAPQHQPAQRQPAPQQQPALQQQPAPQQQPASQQPVQQQAAPQQQPAPQHQPAPQQPVQQQAPPQQQPAPQQTGVDPEKVDVDVTMVEL